MKKVNDVKHVFIPNDYTGLFLKEIVAENPDDLIVYTFSRKNKIHTIYCPDIKKFNIPSSFNITPQDTDTTEFVIDSQQNFKDNRDELVFSVTLNYGISNTDQERNIKKRS